MTFYSLLSSAGYSCDKRYIFLRASLLSVSRRHATTLSGTDYLDSAAAKNTTDHPFPFPEALRPNPHEIFHLPTSASSADIKSRYYDLVRYHHPDSPHARAHTPCPNKRNTRFQAILSAYDTLQNPSSARATWGYYGTGPGFDPYVAEINRRRRTSQNAEHLKQRRRAMKDEQRHREQEEWNRSAGGIRERIMVGLGVFALLAGLYPSFFLFPLHLDKTHQDAVANLTKARSDAQEVGHLRREEVRKRVKNMKAPMKEAEESNDKV